jgi:site-specific DNA recombinase
VVIDKAVPALVSGALWEAAQTHDGTRRFGVGRPWQRPYLLSGLITCGHCGKRFQAHKPVRRHEFPYYVCGGYIASGRSVCDGLRVPMASLDTVVLHGIQTRIDRLLNRDELRQRLDDILATEHPNDGVAEALQARLDGIRQRIDRLVAVITAGPEDLPTIRTALVGLERERAGVEAELAEATARATRAEDRDATVEAMLECLNRSRELLEAADVEERRALVRLFARGIEIQKRARRAIVSWYRLPTGGDGSLKLAAPTRFEPVFQP